MLRSTGISDSFTKNDVTLLDFGVRRFHLPQIHLGTQLKDMDLAPLGCSWHRGDSTDGKGFSRAPSCCRSRFFWGSPSLKCEKRNYLVEKVDF